jgi:hypothetical protein
MAHFEQIEFCKRIRLMFQERFVESSVLDCGSLDINGSNRYLFENCTYIGIDISSGKNVDNVCLIHKYKSDIKFDVIISTETLEHDMYYKLSLSNIIQLLKPNGLIIITCATTGRIEHGTKSLHPGTSPTSQIPGWEYYYHNLTIDDIRRVIDLDSVFERYGFEINNSSKDLYFWGISHNNEIHK